MDKCDNSPIDFWRKKANEYEWLYRQQKEIASSYRKVLEELQSDLHVMSLKTDFIK